MTGIRNFMTDDHRRCDDYFAWAEDALKRNDLVATLAAFRQFRLAMYAHFEAEEDTLFPAFEAATGMRTGPTQVMRMEHDQMRAQLADAEQALVAGLVDDYAGMVETLLIMMQQHNMKEENILYPMCDQHLAGESVALLAKLQAECVPA
jgi:DUF438 domain-containing protein